MELKSMNELETVVEKAIEEKETLGILIEMPDFIEPELITNPTINLKKKLEYWKSVYDENLEHKHAKGIKIIACEFGGIGASI